MSATAPTSFDVSLPDVLFQDAARSVAGRADGSSPQSFAAELESAGKSGKPTLRESADQLVSTAFILPLLEKARNDPFKSELFHGGRGEEVFGQQLDVIFADNITKSSNFGISDALVRRFQPATSSNHEVNLRG